ncbi:HAD-IIIC family phosphatase [Kordia sp. YSTF-M3]|uniref:HAD-IIIC family phosphatase n=1 Tax=Kordia aestuariivivens TaxID=2759037 RepID=A0ABR7QEF8_9FLAO|nr:HAD-IIIC family phosphatase [Kordia aestuariivivens]MBC8756873.1 HAD-IIIC family phosphatase [Kordia aestuariivivens]
MSVYQIIKKVKEKGIHLSIENGKLKISAAKGVFSDEIIEDIKKNKEALIRLLSQSNYEPIPVAKSSESYPLSYSQSVFWILNQLGHKDTTHNITSVFRCEGVLNISSLEMAFKKMIVRHEVLRTIFKENQKGIPAQFILPKDETSFKIIHHNIENSNHTEKEIHDTLHTEITSKFNLSTGPLFRVSTISINTSETILCCVFNHIIVDGWSMFLIMKETLKFYDEIEAQTETNLTPLEVQYKDYAVWQKNRLETEKGVFQKEYWKKKLGETIPVLNLPSFKERPKVKTYNGSTTTSFFKKGLLKKINTFSAQQNTTVFTVLIAVLNALFNRYTGDEDIIIGTLVAGREHPDLENQIGMYANMLALRTAFKNENSFLELVEIQKESLLNDFENQNYPFNKLLSDLSIKRDLSRSALFDVVAIFQNQDSVTGTTELENESLKIAAYEKLKTASSQVDLKFDFLEDNGELRLRIEYNTDVYDASFIQKLVQHLQNCLENVLDFPNQLISNIDFLSLEEKEELSNFGKKTTVSEFAETTVSNPKTMILSDKFMEQSIGVYGKVYIQTAVSDSENDLAFIENPIQEGTFLIDSGKKGRWLPDGTIEYLEEKISEPQPVSKSLDTLHIISSYTVAPLAGKLEWFLDEFAQPHPIKLGKYNQVFQEFIALNDNNAENAKSILVVLNRFEDYLVGEEKHAENFQAKLDQVYEDLLKVITHQSQTSTIIMVFSHANENLYDQKIVDYIHLLNKKSIKALAELGNIHCIHLENPKNELPSLQVFDDLTEEMGHIPFTETFFYTIAQRINRVLWGLKSKNCKVIALDCDHTLWEGVCGESNVNDLVISEGHKLLQQFMIQKYKEGFLLVLLSKNNESAVWDVFENHPDMLLTKEHLVGWKINWDSKAGNIQQLAEELNLGLESFAFVDDNPLECHLMMEENPEVLTLELPKKPEHFDEFLQHVISFDKQKVSKEDTLRTEMYKTEKTRIASRKKLNLEDFLKSLKLELSFNHVNDAQIDRVAQLTHRTNQFSLNGIRKNNKEVIDFIKEKDNACFVINVRDKFGTYGLVGAILVSLKGETLFIENFMLSCRVLGRAVEETIITILKQKYAQSNCKLIVAKYIDTKKNVPIHDFLIKNTWMPFDQDNTSGYKIAMKDVSEHTDYITSYLDQELPLLATKKSTITIEKDTVNNHSVTEAIQENKKETWLWEKNLINESELFHKQTYKALEYANLGFLKKLEAYAFELDSDQYNEFENKLISFFKILLNVREVTITDRFFDLGGNSINATQLVSKIYQEFDVKLDLVYIFNNNTIQEMSEHIKEQKEIASITQEEFIDDMDSYKEIEF